MEPELVELIDAQVSQLPAEDSHQEIYVAFETLTPSEEAAVRNEFGFEPNHTLEDVRHSAADLQKALIKIKRHLVDETSIVPHM